MRPLLRFDPDIRPSHQPILLTLQPLLVRPDAFISRKMEADTGIAGSFRQCLCHRHRLPGARLRPPVSGPPGRLRLRPLACSGSNALHPARTGRSSWALTLAAESRIAVRGLTILSIPIYLLFLGILAFYQEWAASVCRHNNHRFILGGSAREERRSVCFFSPVWRAFPSARRP